MCRLSEGRAWCSVSVWNPSRPRSQSDADVSLTRVDAQAQLEKEQEEDEEVYEKVACWCAVGLILGLLRG